MAELRIVKIATVAVLALLITTAPSAGTAAGAVAAATESGDARNANGKETLVDLVWEPVTNWVYVGQVFELHLIARTDNAMDQAMGALDVVLTWDAAHLELLGLNDEGPYEWLLSDFPDDSQQDGLNNSLLDGDGFYQAWSRFGDLAVATPQGLHVTTFLFEAVQPTESAQVAIVDRLGVATESRVYGEQIGQIVTGQLGTIGLPVCPGAPGDDDGDGVENCFDACPATPAGEPVGVDGCGCSQLECDDGLFCNGAEGCADGECQPGDPPDCDDGMECTVDRCDPAANEGLGACVNEPAPAETACGDPTATECDQPDTCDGAGACQPNFVGTGANCGDPTDDDCTDPDSCDGAGFCLDNHAVDGTACTDDGNECTDDVCLAGACTHTNEPAETACGDPTGTECDDPDTCDGEGNCVANHVDAGAACGNPTADDCTAPDTCDGAGACLENHEPDGMACTDDEIECTQDVCNAGVCTHPNEPDGTTCGSAAETECDQPDTCDGMGTCQTNYVAAGAACGDPTNDNCTAPDTCDGTGICLRNDADAGTPCPDELFCNGQELCDGEGVCQPGEDPCTDSAQPFCSEEIGECVECLEHGDINGDGFVDLQDLAALPECITGPVGPVAPPDYLLICRCLDADADGDVDLIDFAGFQENFDAGNL